MSIITRTGLALGVGVAVGASMAPALAADHIDAPAVVADPATDLTDVFAWMEDGQLNLALDIPGAAGFSDAVQYVFHLESAPAYGMTGSSTTILCTFNAAQTIQCWLDDQVYVTGDAGTPAGLANEDGTFRVFAGLRNDPFYFNFSGFTTTIDAVVDAAGGLAFDDAGCPTLDAATSQVLVTQLQTEPGGDPAVDDFAGSNVRSLVVQVDPSLVNQGGPVLAVWASTRR